MTADDARLPVEFKVFGILVVAILSFALYEEVFTYGPAYTQTFSQSNIRDALNSSAGIKETWAVIESSISSKRQKIVAETDLNETLAAWAFLNELRVDRGLKPLAWDDNMYRLAKWRAEDMTTRGYFDHIDPDGKYTEDYAARFNVVFNGVTENIYGGSGEKLAIGAWMDSPGHRANLLNPDITRGALGCDGNCVFIASF